MNNKLDDKLLIVQDLAVTKKQVTDELKQDNVELKEILNKHDSYLDKIRTLTKQVLIQNQTSLPKTMYSTMDKYPATVVPDKNNDPQLKGGHYTKVCGM